MTTRPGPPEPPGQPCRGTRPPDVDMPRADDAQPPALIILNYDVVDEDALQAYRVRATGQIDAAPGKLLTSVDQTLSLSEGPATGTHTVIVWYPSLAVAKARYESAAYQALVPRRLAATTPRAAFAVELATTRSPHHRADPTTTAPLASRSPATSQNDYLEPR